MLRQGPIPVSLHGIIEYLAGVLCIAAPFIFAFDSGAATAASIVAGVVILAMAAVTTGPTSLVNSLPVAVHVVLDFILAGVFIAAPFVFDFSSEGPATAFFLIVGVAHLLITIGTRFEKRRTYSARA